jgi:hypothetical protein
LAAIVTVLYAAQTRLRGPSGNQADIREPNLLLPDGWLAERVAEMQRPAELQVPLGERWRFEPNAVPIHAAVWRQFVYVSYAKLDPSVNVSRLIEQQKAGRQIRPKMQHVTECRDIDTGNVLWSNTEVSGGIIALPGYLLLHRLTGRQLEQELVVLESAQGRVVKRFLYSVETTPDYERIRRLRESPLEFAEARALDVWRRELQPLLSETSPVPPDMAQWTSDDAKIAWERLSCPYLMRYGQSNDRYLYPNAEDVVFLSTTRQLVRRSASEDRVYWRHISSTGSRQRLLWQPPYILAFSAPTAVTAYRIDDGSPAWTYEFPADTLNGGPVHRFASLADGILLLSEPLRGLSETAYQSLPRPEREALRGKQSQHLWLTKLDFNGNRLFQQELTMKSNYQEFVISQGHLLLCTHDTLVCYGPTDATPRTEPPDTLPPLTEEQRQLEIERLHAEYDKFDPGIFERIRICHELGRLRDRSMLERVLADLAQADAHKDIYIKALGVLSDRRAIDTLIRLLKQESPLLQFAIRESLERLTSIRGLSSQDWEEWWQIHRSLYLE